MLRRGRTGGKKLVEYIVRFYPAGNYNWPVPDGCKSVDAFIVGGGGAGEGRFLSQGTGGGSGYTKTFKKDTAGWRDGDAASVTPGQQIEIIVGEGGKSGSGTSSTGGFSQFLNSNYQALGGHGGYTTEADGAGGSSGGRGGSQGVDGSWAGGSDGNDGVGQVSKSQGHTTRDFGDPTGKINAGAGGGCATSDNTGGLGGDSDYQEGSGDSKYSSSNIRYGRGGGGYGGGGGAGYGTTSFGNGGDGTVLLRFKAYKGYMAPAGATIESII